MTELEKKAEEYAKSVFSGNDKSSAYYQQLLFSGFIKGYKQGQKDFDTDVTKLLNSYGVTFIDTNSIGGLIGLHELMLDLEKENEKLKAKIEKMKCCGNCNKKYCHSNNAYYNYCIANNKSKWELAE